MFNAYSGLINLVLINCLLDVSSYWLFWFTLCVICYEPQGEQWTINIVNKYINKTWLNGELGTTVGFTSPNIYRQNNQDREVSSFHCKLWKFLVDFNCISFILETQTHGLQLSDSWLTCLRDDVPYKSSTSMSRVCYQTGASHANHEAQQIYWQHYQCSKTDVYWLPCISMNSAYTLYKYESEELLTFEEMDCLKSHHCRPVELVGFQNCSLTSEILLSMTGTVSGMGKLLPVNRIAL